MVDFRPTQKATGDDRGPVGGVDAGPRRSDGPAFADVVGQPAMRTALLAVGADPDLNGVLLRGEKGTAKSTAVRALAGSLPEQRVVSDCPFGCSPTDPATQCRDCRERHDPPVDRRTVPLVELPLGASRERVVGSLSVTDALEGEATFDPGLLARAHRGILYVDEVNLLADHLVDDVLAAAASGRHRVERDGVSVSHPADVTLVGTMNPEEGDLRPQLRDRFAIQAEVSGLADLDERVRIVDHAVDGVTRHSDTSENRSSTPTEAEDADAFVPYLDAGISTSADERLDHARSRLQNGAVGVDEEHVRHIARICREAGADGHRADIAATRTARALAALAGRENATAHDVDRALAFALPHRLGGDPFGDTPDVEELLENSPAPKQGQQNEGTSEGTDDGRATDDGNQSGDGRASEEQSTRDGTSAARSEDDAGSSPTSDGSEGDGPRLEDGTESRTAPGSANGGQDDSRGGRDGNGEHTAPKAAGHGTVTSGQSGDAAARTSRDGAARTNGDDARREGEATAEPGDDGRESAEGNRQEASHGDADGGGDSDGEADADTSTLRDDGPESADERTENGRERLSAPGSPGGHEPSSTESGVDWSASGVDPTEADLDVPLVPGAAGRQTGSENAADATELSDSTATSGSATTVGADGPRVRTRPAGEDDPVDVAASVREAATNGRQTPSSGDLVASVRASAARTLVVVAVDASASMRPAMARTKSVVLELLRDAYVHRDEVAVVGFAGDGADVLVPPTDSVALAARHLKDVPTGDRTPLPAGLRRTGQVVADAHPGRSLAVVVTDGRPNVAEGSPVAATERAARQLGEVVDETLLVDARAADTGGRGGASDAVADRVLSAVQRSTAAQRLPLASLSADAVDEAAADSRE